MIAQANTVAFNGTTAVLEAPNLRVQSPTQRALFLGALCVSSVTGVLHPLTMNNSAPRLVVDLGTNAASRPAQRTAGTSEKAGTAARVSGLKEGTELTWAQLASLFGVSRRAVHHWAEGGNMAAANAERLDELCNIVAGSGCPTAHEVNRWLFSATPGATHSRYSTLVEALPGYTPDDGRRLIDMLGTGVEPQLAVTGTADNVRSLGQQLRDF